MRLRWAGGLLPATAAILAGVAPLALAGQRMTTAHRAGSSQSGLHVTTPVRAGTSQSGLHVIPFPRTPDASTQSQIIFSSLRPSDLAGNPVVSGSSSGLHPGRLVRLPDHAGTEFEPTEPFTPGEKVTVHALLTSPQAGTASGAPGSTSLTYTFTVASPPPATTTAIQSPPRAVAHATSHGHSVFRSEPGLRPPPVHFGSPAPGSADILVSPRSKVLFAKTPRHSSSQSGPMILNPRGQLLWFDPLGGNTVPFNLEEQTYRHEPVLTWFQGGPGEPSQDVIMNSSYQPVAVLRGGWGYGADLHEFQITPQGTALIDAVVPVRANLTSIGGPADGAVNDYVIQELDIPTGQVLWEWHALGHVPIKASYWPHVGQGAYDAYHLNSIQQLPGHRLLISIRHTWAVYELDERTGHVIWTLGGKRSSFHMGPGTSFQWQHDAHLYDRDRLTLFDDAWALGARQEKPQSTAKELKVDTRHHTVSLVRTYRHSPPLLTGAEGSAQLLFNHDLFVGWGTEPVFSQYAPSGRQIFSASFPLGVDTYRAYRFHWTGHPVTAPALAVAKGKHGTVWLYASWNGATQVAAWRVFAGSSPHKLSWVEARPWRGFETTIHLHSSARYFAVAALNASHKVLRRSAVLPVPRG